ncbi:MAG: hypothetical protein RLZZ422_479 [Pseudomonadota bacterium]|jgi:uncharacterized membrane protein
MENFESKAPPNPDFIPDINKLFNSYPVNTVTYTSITSWINKGWSDFKVNPAASLTYGVIFALVGWLMSWVAGKNPAFIAATSTGFVIAGPFLALGLYDLSRQIEQGKKPSLLQSLQSIKHNSVALGIYAVFLGLLMVVWVRLSAVITGMAFNETASVDNYGYIGLLQALLTANDGVLFALAFFGIGLLITLLAFITGVVTVPLLLDRKTDIVTAGTTSVRAFKKNPVTLLLWGFIIGVLTQIGILTLNIGLILIMPLLGHASWHAYRDIVAQK